VSEAMDRLSFSPWHTTQDHRPLGNIMRARRVAYIASSALRGHSPEPDTPTSLKAPETPTTGITWSPAFAPDPRSSILERPR
jgi:hypothetical protein